MSTSRPDQVLPSHKGLGGAGETIQVQVKTMKISYRMTSLAPKGDRLIIGGYNPKSCPNMSAKRGVAPFVRLGAYESSQDTLLKA